MPKLNVIFPRWYNLLLRDVSLAKLCTVDQEEAKGDDCSGQEDDARGLFSEKDPAVHGRKNGAEKSHE